MVTFQKSVMKKLLLVHTLTIYCLFAIAKNSNQKQKNDSNIAVSVNRDGISRFSLYQPIAPSDIFSIYKTDLGMPSLSEMKNTKNNSDDMGFVHYRYQQYYKGYVINGAEYILHSKNNIAITGNGNIVNSIEGIPTVNFSESAAVQKAMQFFKSEKYAWQIPQLEEDKKKREHNEAATWFPKASLQWVLANEKVIDIYKLAYVIDICNAQLQLKRLYIDANTGTLIKELRLEYTCFSSSVNTNFNGLQNIFTFYTGPAGYFLWDQCQTAFVHVRKWANPLSSSVEYTSSNNDWSGATSAATSLWTVKKASDYFSGIHSRNGWNGAGAGINVYHEALFSCDANGCSDPNNASFSSGILKVGNSGTANTIDDWNSLDIMAHEVAHGVTQSSANLDYSNESGALNESFSDIFAANCYQWFQPSNTNIWLIGFDRKNPNNNTQSLYIRNMSNPNDRSHPDTYLGNSWYAGSSDNGGVHTNSGVQNFMYYLLVNGGLGTNDYGNAYQVSGIGFEKARRIAYHTLTNYLTSTSGYNVARNAWVHAAAQLYGECSFEAIQTGKAWAAVGITPPSAGAYYYCGTYGASPYFNNKTGSIYLSYNCNTSISNSGNQVRFTSGEKVVIGSGFSALSGSKFKASLNECGFAFY